MVYKVSKGGVRSGNTLRCLRSLRTKRYSSQACILSRSNFHPVEVPRFLESATEDQLVTSTLGSTDVLLSLNKKGRWRLPATVSHMIKTGHFSEEKTMVSFLERHKLKKRANCVSFVCNQSRLRNVAPKQKRYFSFNLENIDNEQSNRQVKREKAIAMTKVKTPVKNKIRNTVKTVEVVTVEGSVKHGLSRSVREFRVEVFHPCPQSCSLVYNPKYTNVQVDSGDSGMKEVKSNSKLSKNKRRHRKRFTANDLKMRAEEMDLGEFWDDDYEDSDFGPVYLIGGDTNYRYLIGGDANYQEGDDSSNKNIPHTTENIEDYGSDESLQFPENILATLICQAEKARSLCGSEPLPQRRKEYLRCLKDGSSDNENKSHIVYIVDNPPTFQYGKGRNIKEPECKTATDVSTTTTTTSATYVNLHYGQVIMKSADTAPEILRAKYGYCYAEADSEPRRFIVNVTDDVHNILGTQRYAEQNAMYTSYLVFVHDGEYDDGLDTFKVIFNSNICTETKAVGEGIPFEETSIETILNHVACALMDTKKEHFLSPNYPPSKEITMNPILKFVNDLMRINMETFCTFDEINRVSQTDAMQENTNFSTSLDNMIRDLDTDVFCDICYENVNPSQPGSIPGTRLFRCGHIFCDDCWRSHFRAKINNGALKMVCPGYECDETVGPVTLLSLLHLSEVTKLFQRKCEREVEATPNSRWCPNPSCGRIVKLGPETSIIDVSFDVTCECGQEFCCLCLSESHWPATCGQAQEYQKKLTVLKLPQESTDDSLSTENACVPLNQLTPEDTEVLEIEGRICPKCFGFIDKICGCDHMICQCGHNFCWKCLQDYYLHVCTPNPSVVFKYSRKVKFNHIIIPQALFRDTQAIKKTKSVASRQRTKMYRKALQQRLEATDCKRHAQIGKMVKQIAHVAQKDLLLKREILSLCGVEVDATDESSLTQASFTPHVTKFLRSCVDIKRALHHVTEFTFVLIQDIPDSVDRRRILRLANDFSGYCSFIKSILELGQNQNLKVAVRRLADIQAWAKRTLTVLLCSIKKLRSA